MMYKTIRNWIGLSAVVMLVGVASAHAGTTYSITDLGDLPGGDNFSYPTDINSTGQVVGGSGAAGGERAFMWENGVMTDLGVLTLDHNHSVATGINDAGQVVGESQHPFLYSNGTMTDLGSFGGGNGFANRINNSTEVVGLSSYSNGVTRAFLWSNGSMIDLGDLGDPYSDAYDINNNSQVVGNSTLNGADRGFIWETGVMTDLGDLPGGPQKTRAYAINDMRQVVGESAVASATVGHAFIWQNGVMTDLEVLPGTESSFALGLNEYGQVVGASYNTSNQQGSRAFLWDSFNGMLDLNDMLDSSGAGWTLLFAKNINESGQIVGGGTTPNGSQHAFLLTPVAGVPEPSTFVLAALGLVGLGCVALRKKYRRS